MHLTLDDDRINVRMVVQDENAKRVLDQQLEPLRVRFNEMGVQLGQLDVRRDGSDRSREEMSELAASRPAAPTAKPERARLLLNYGPADGSVGRVDVFA